jgi:flagellar M-ring protein FliF
VRNPGALKGLTAAVFIAQQASGADHQLVKRTETELAALRQVVINALGVHAAAGQAPESIVSLQEVPFQTTPVAAQVEQIQKETRVAAWLETASRYVAVVVALGVLAVFWRMLRRLKPEAVPVEMLNETSGNGPRGLSVTGPVTPELLNELIRQKPANIGAALRDWAAVKKN